MQCTVTHSELKSLKVLGNLYIYLDREHRSLAFAFQNKLLLNISQLELI